MTALTPTQIAGVAYNAGFRGQDLVDATAVALAESSGNPDSHNLNPGTGDDSWGLWQVNLAPGAHAGQWAPDWLTNPANNAVAAKQIHDQAGGWGPWTTYGKDRYQQALPVATQAVAALGNGFAVPVSGSPAPPAYPGAAQTQGAQQAWDKAGSKIAQALGLNDLAEKALQVVLTGVLVAAGLGLIAMGFWRLTGRQPSDLLDSAGKAASAGGLIAAAV